MSWDWEQERDKVAVSLREDIGFPIGPLELADQMHLDALTAMVIERVSRVAYGRGTGELIGFLGTGTRVDLSGIDLGNPSLGDVAERHGRPGEVSWTAYFDCPDVESDQRRDTDTEA